MLAQVFQRLTVSEELCSELCPEEGAGTPYFKPKIERKEMPARSLFRGCLTKKRFCLTKREGFKRSFPFVFRSFFINALSTKTISYGRMPLVCDTNSNFLNQEDLIWEF